MMARDHGAVARLTGFADVPTKIAPSSEGHIPSRKP
jgi:hypothetical protein